LCAAAISRWASALDGLARELLRVARFVRILEQDLRDGQHRNPTERLDYFTTAFFTIPDQFAEETRAAGLTLIGIYGSRGPAGCCRMWPSGWAIRRAVMACCMWPVHSTEPFVLGTSVHLMAVARLPTEAHGETP
jgi:hypothetical protein